MLTCDLCGAEAPSLTVADFEVDGLDEMRTLSVCPTCCAMPPVPWALCAKYAEVVGQCVHCGEDVTGREYVANTSRRMWVECPPHYGFTG